MSSTNCPMHCVWKNDAGYFTLVKAGIYYAFFLWPFLFLIVPCILRYRTAALRIVLLVD